MNILYKRKNKPNKGFTLIELIITISIIAITAAIAIPSVIGYIDTSKLVNRQNIARTLYLASQNQLTEMLVTKNLDEFAKGFYVGGDLQKLELNDVDRVYYQTDTPMPNTENPQNQNLVRFIKKDSGNMPTSLVHQLLDPVIIDKEILNQAICIEFNIQTGVVLSVFYSDEANALNYEGTANDNTNISGARPYNLMRERNQGYYGVNNTGQVSPPNVFDIADIYDGANADHPLKDKNSAIVYRNVLYADMLVPKDAQKYTFEIVNEKDTGNVLYTTGEITLPSTAGKLDEAIANPVVGADGKKHVLYKLDIEKQVIINGIDITKSYDRYIWILDMVYGDTYVNTENMYATKYQGVNPPQNIRVTAKRNVDTQSIPSLSYANSHYFTSNNSLLPTYTIASARHLYNIRSVTDGQFKQITDVPMLYEGSEKNTVTNFKPIDDFSGFYSGMKENSANQQYKIKDLNIKNTAENTNVGLFANVVQSGLKSGRIQGVSLLKANIESTTGGSVGSIAGEIKSGKLYQSNAFANVTVSGATTSKVGGLVGSITNAGSLEYCYNGGYFDATNRQYAQKDAEGNDITDENGLPIINNPKTGFVTAEGNSLVSIGGLVGENAGKVEFSYNNARVNISEVDVGAPGAVEEYLSYLKTPEEDSYPNLTNAASNIGGIVGLNSGSIKNTYATNFVGKNKAKTSNSGGIAGRNTVAEKNISNCYFLSNGLTAVGGNANNNPATAVELKKEQLSKMTTTLGTGFLDGLTYKQGVNMAVGEGGFGYPYPVLRDNGHFTDWEDILTKPSQEKVDFAELKYYEVYKNNINKMVYGVTDSIKEPLAAVASDSIVVNDGYCIDFEYFSPVTIVLGEQKYVIEDTSNSRENPTWTFIENGTNKLEMKNLPIYIETIPAKDNIAEKFIFRIFLENNIVEEICKTPKTNITNKEYITRVQLLQQDKRILTGSSDKTVTNSETDVFFGPLYANAIFKSKVAPPESPIIFSVRSPRQVDNIDFSIKATNISATNNQELNIDFEPYRRYIENDTATKGMRLVANSAISKNKPVVEETLVDLYDGKNMYIRNVRVEDNSSENVGLFAKVGKGGIVRNVALLKSNFKGVKNVGSIAGVNDYSGTVENCEVSDVTVISVGTDVKTSSAGGILGQNFALLQNVYFNSTYREAGNYVSPVKGGNINSTGGLVGKNMDTTGVIRYAYTDSVAPNKNASVGQTVLPLSNVYYLKGAGYNDTVAANQGEAKTAEELETIAMGSNAWDKATLETTKEAQAGLIYPFPKIKDMNHYFDWPMLEVTLKYYEKYSDGTYGYYYKINNISVDGLKYNPDITVTEEGYIVDVMNMGKYNVEIENKTIYTGRDTKIIDGKNVIVLEHSIVDPLIGSGDIAAAGISSLNIKVFKSEIPKIDLLENKTFGSAYFNPLFAKEIDFSKTSPGRQKDFEVRSPRQMMNINPNGTNINAQKFLRTFNYKQTISLNFANTVVNGRPIFTLNGNPLGDMSNYIIDGDFSGTYDGSYLGVSNRIYNLLLKVINNNDDSRKNTAGTFKTIANGGKINNLEYIDPQMRYYGDRNASHTNPRGMGGGVVANINYGVIDNVNVSHTKPTNLFADSTGGISTRFCGDKSKPGCVASEYGVSGSIPTEFYAHAHGGIAGIVIGKDAKISNCYVGTNSGNIQEILQNNTKISCHSLIQDVTEVHILIGGIAGGISDNAKVISCINISSINPVMDFANPNASGHAVGGIVGRIGNQNAGSLQTQYISRGDIIGCYNAGSIELKIGFAGGIVGRTQGIRSPRRIPAKIVSCYNTGRVNIVNNDQGEIVEIPFSTSNALRLGAIVGESDMTSIYNTYNIGYISGAPPPDIAESNAGIIIGLPTFTNSHVEYCYSLKADKYAPKTIVGNKFYEGALINEVSDSEILTKLFQDFWLPREQLRNNTTLINPDYAGEYYPGLMNTPGIPNAIPASGKKLYPVFSSTGQGFYIYPQLENFTYEGVEYHNPHITPFEYIDSVYETTLKYYETYKDKTIGTYYLDIRGENNDTLLTDAVVTKDGYYLEIGQIGNYEVVINNSNPIAVTAVKNVLNLGVTGIEFNDEMKSKLNQSGYNKICLYTKTGTASFDSINRMIGASTTKGSNEGTDVYFDYLFPREIQYADAKIDVALLSRQTNAIRSPRHMANISALTKVDLSLGKTFNQELNIDFSSYQIPAYATFDKSVITGEFKGEYNGKYKTIGNLKINGATDVKNIGLFEKSIGTIKNFILENAIYTSTLPNTPIVDDTLNMGSIAAVNEGNISYIQVASPLIGGSISDDVQNIGGIAGTNGITNTGAIIKDVYLVTADTVSPVPVSTKSTGTKNNIGGFVGNNAGKIERVMYLAKAPNTNPITGINTGDGVKDKTDLAATPPIQASVFYLAGKGYNNFDSKNVVGISKSTGQLTQLRDNIILSGWSDAWGKVAAFPYPSLIGIKAPTTFPVAESMDYSLAYYEKYADNTYGWYYSKNDGTIVNTLTMPLTSVVTNKTVETGYGVIVPNNTDAYRLNVNETDTASTLIMVDGKHLLPLEQSAVDGKPLKVTVNGFEMPSGFTYYNPLTAKAMYKTNLLFVPPAKTFFYIRTPQQMQNINKIVVMSHAEYAEYHQEIDIDFTGIVLKPEELPNLAVPLDNSVISADFIGVYNGNNRIISNLIINAIDATVIPPTYRDNIGLFSKNFGYILNISLVGTSSITGNNNVSGIAGVNGNSGTITGCIVMGDPLAPTTIINAGGGSNDAATEMKSICGKNENTPESIAGNNLAGTWALPINPVPPNELPTSSATPTIQPTAAPTLQPTPIPTGSAQPTPQPTGSAQPTPQPTGSAQPTITPTSAPTITPTSAPTVAPTSAPTVAPTSAPTVVPTTAPTVAPVDTTLPVTIGGKRSTSLAGRQSYSIMPWLKEGA